MIANAQPFSFKPKNIELSKLLLDPNNYRFLDRIGFKKKIKTKFHAASAQQATLELLEKQYQLDELKKSIKANGYVPMERIIVVPYKFKHGYYLVVEGNRRVAALKSLLREEQESIIELSESEKEAYSEIPCAVLMATGEKLQHAERVIMGIRHIAGPKEWGAYQQAQLITELRDDEGSEFQQIGENLGISPVEAARRYRAMRALRAMEADELYSTKANPGLYRLFHEMVSLPTVRERFGWSVADNAFTDIDKARQFYELIAPQEGEDAKLSTYGDVRKLRYIIGNAKAEECLFAMEEPLNEALRIASAGKDLGSVKDILIEVEHSLKKIDITQIESLEQSDITLINSITNTLEKLKKWAEK